MPQHEDLEVLVAVASPRADGQGNEERHEMREYKPEHPLPPHGSAPVGGAMYTRSDHSRPREKPGPDTTVLDGVFTPHRGSAYEDGDLVFATR